MIKQHVSQKLLQKLSPQQIQLMKLLQIPTSILDQRIQEELEVNPALEEGDEDYDDEHLDRYDKNDHEDPQDSGSDSEMADSNDHFEKEESHDNDFEEYLSLYMDDDTAGYKYKSDDYGADMDEHKTIPVAVENTFHDHLEKQIGLLRLKTEDQYKIALQIIGSIDDDGYLRREPSAIIDDLIFAQNIDTNEKEILAILAKIQTFEPLGVGARNLQECLLIQIRGKQKVNNVKHLQKSLRIAELILEEFFDEFSKKHYIKLQRSLNITESQLKSALDEILKLNPDRVLVLVGLR